MGIFRAKYCILEKSFQEENVTTAQNAEEYAPATACHDATVCYSQNSITPTFSETFPRRGFGESRKRKPRNNDVTVKFRRYGLLNNCDMSRWLRQSL